MSDVSDVVDAVVHDPEVYYAIKYISPTYVARATRRRFRAYNKKQRKDQAIEMVVHVGRPNYKERDFIKDAKKAGEPFPIKRVQVRRNAV